MKTKRKNFLSRAFVFFSVIVFCVSSFCISSFAAGSSYSLYSVCTLYQYENYDSSDTWLDGGADVTRGVNGDFTTYKFSTAANTKTIVMNLILSDFGYDLNPGNKYRLHFTVANDSAYYWYLNYFNITILLESGSSVYYNNIPLEYVDSWNGYSEVMLMDGNFDIETGASNDRIKQFRIEFVCANSPIPARIDTLLVFPYFDLSVVNPLTDPVYPAPDTGGMDDLDSAEGNLKEQNEQGMQNANNYQTDALTAIAQYVGGFQALSAVVGKFSDLTFVGALLTLSIALGLFAFLVGMLGTAIWSTRREARHDRLAAERRNQRRGKGG